ncbi:MAG: hypothetical protein ACOY4K_12915 [Pseudomonadota bacterium]
MTDGATLLQWRSRVDALLKRDYCIDLADAGASDADVERYFRYGESPVEFVEWFAEKYDLQKLSMLF